MCRHIHNTHISVFGTFTVVAANVCNLELQRRLQVKQDSVIHRCKKAVESLEGLSLKCKRKTNVSSSLVVRTISNVSVLFVTTVTSLVSFV